MPALLLVDDDDDMRSALQHFLTDEGFVVHTARNGRDALERLRQIEPPGLILLDLMMPEMDGHAFLAARAADPDLARLPVVIMSAWTKAWQGKPPEVEDVLRKPIRPEHLLPLVERYCDRRPRASADAP